MNPPKRIILAITGATGMLYVEPLLTLLGKNGVTVHGMISDAGRKVLWLEQGMEPEALPNVERWFAVDDFTAPMASGSSLYDAMIILPCTVGTLGAIAGGFSGNLIHRAADVTLKERRPLILAVRETPLNRTHLTNMLRAHEAGATIFPPMPSFYHKPATLEDLARHYAGRLCDHLGIRARDMKRWGG
ncbi:MAG: UbiX family flavin prenyltransferase [Desulfobulbaceae bacterium]|jgi:4-hydroxy-3-polyprenylbenzoate decarboxylase|nr:UbiX family flavin prenyltransferase [Desulfobulbaceae bacterium]MDY0352304.1 UbiX family flavin prenyltransferase [Desulfobulbaceae bacterium]